MARVRSTVQGFTRRPFRIARLLAVALIVAGGALLAYEPPVAVQMLRELVWDQLVAARPRPVDPSLNIRIIDVDEESLAAYGQFPWPRSRQARLLEALRDQGVAVVAYDFIFPEPDRTSIGNVLKSMTDDIPGYVPPLDAGALAAQPDNDAIFARTIATVPTVLGFTLGPPGVERNPPRPIARIEFERRRDQRYVPAYPGVVGSLPVLQEAAAGNGGVGMTTDPDGVLRRIPILVAPGRRALPSLSAEAVRVATGEPIVMGTRDPGLDGARFGTLAAPTDPYGRLRLYDSGHRPERYISARAVLDGSLPPGTLDGAIAFIGTSAEGLKDIRSTPLNLAGPGVEAHVQAVEQVLSGQFLTRLRNGDAVEAGVIAAAGLVLLLLAAWPVAALPPWLAALFASAGIAGAAWFAFSTRGVLIDPLVPAAALLLAGVSERLILLAEVRMERSRIRNAFSRYLSPDVVAKVSEDPEQLRLGGDRRDLSVMFCDIRGFTALSQKFTDQPEALTSLINRLLTPLTQVVLSHRGTVDKYMGDCIMAFWNAPLDTPDHAVAACQSALDMRAALKSVNAELQAEFSDVLADGIDIGIGINSGSCFVGNMGSEQRLDYSAIGDAVNLASRLEGQCKTYGVGIVISEDTARELGNTFPLFELDRVVVKGRALPTPVFTVLGRKDGRFDPLIAEQAAFLAAYRAQDWDRADAILDSLRQAPEAEEAELADYLASMAERIADFRLTPPPTDWDGRHIATSK